MERCGRSGALFRAGGEARSAVSLPPTGRAQYCGPEMGLGQLPRSPAGRAVGAARSEEAG